MRAFQRAQDSVQWGKLVVIGIVIAVIAGVFFSMVAGYLFVQWLTRRIEHMSQVAMAVADGDLNRRIQEKGSDELALLSQHFNLMVESLGQSQEKMKLQAAQAEESASAAIAAKLEAEQAGKKYKLLQIEY